MGNRLMGVKQPQQAQEPNEHDLAEQRIPVNEKGNPAAHNGGFDQIKDRHITMLGFGPGTRLPARPSPTRPPLT
jgi:hypothetical protein